MEQKFIDEYLNSKEFITKLGEYNKKKVEKN